MRANPNTGPRNRPFNLVAPVSGLDAKSALLFKPSRTAVALENWVPYPDRLESRPGYVPHLTALPNPGRKLHTYNSILGIGSLWVTTDSGVYNATTAGAAGAAAIALTDGRTISTSIATGAGSFLLLANGVDTIKQYNGTAWSSIAVFGATATSVYSYIETYRQRIFLVKKNSLEIEYLPVNSIAGAPTNYPLGAIFRRGGYIVAIATWTIDSGVGPDDHLAIITSEGEIAVFAGADPATWSFRGAYFLGKPLGRDPLLKFGGDLLMLCELGLYPLSSALQSTAVDRIQPITENIRPLFNSVAGQFSQSEGWQIISQPAIPLLIVNIPSSPVRKQFVMHPQTGAWTTFTGWDALSFARLGAELFFSTSSGVQRVSGVADNGTNITCTMLQAYNKFGAPGLKRTSLVRPYLDIGGSVDYILGLSSDFKDAAQLESQTYGGMSTALWGTAIWGTAIWGASFSFLQDWVTIPDEPSLWKGFYLQISSLSGTVKYYGADFLLLDGGSF